MTTSWSTSLLYLETSTFFLYVFGFISYHTMPNVKWGHLLQNDYSFNMYLYLKCQTQRKKRRTKREIEGNTNIEYLLHLLFLACPIQWTNNFLPEGSANTKNTNTTGLKFKIESCCDCKVDHGGKEHSQWQHFLF